MKGSGKISCALLRFSATRKSSHLPPLLGTWTLADSVCALGIAPERPAVVHGVSEMEDVVGVANDDCAIHALSAQARICHAREICVLESIIDDGNGIGASEIEAGSLEIRECIRVEDQAFEYRIHRADILGTVLHGHDERTEMDVLVCNRRRWKAADVRELIAAERYVLNSRSFSARPGT